MKKSMNFSLANLAILSLFFLAPLFVLSEVARTNREQTITVNTAGPSARENRSDQCPSAMREWIESDFNNNVFLGLGKFSQTEAMQKQCIQSMKDSQAILSKKSVKETPSSTASAESFTKAISQKYKSIAPATAITLDECNKMPEGKSEILKTRYFSSMAKLESTNSTLIDEIAFYDGLLDGDRKTNQLSCNPAFPFPEVSKKCANNRGKLNSKECTDNKTERMNQMVSKTINIADEVDGLKKAFEECMKTKGRKWVPSEDTYNEFSLGGTVEETGACDNIKAAIAIKESEAPWIKSDQFQRTLKEINFMKMHGRTAQQIQDRYKKAVVEEMTKTRDNLTKAYNKNIEYSECMTFSSSRGTAKCDYDDLKNHLAALPPAKISVSSQGRQIDSEIQTRVDAEQCISNAVTIREDFKKKVRDDSFQYLSYLSLALPVIGIPGRFLAAGMNGLSQMKRVQIIQAGLVAATAGTALTQGVRASLDVCKQAGEVVLKKIDKSPKAQQSGLTCASVLDPEIDAATNSYNDCVITALLTSADVFPFTKSLSALKNSTRLSEADLLKLFKDPNQRAEVEKILRKNGKLDDAERMKAAETMVGRELSEKEKDCVRNVHNMFPGKGMKIEATDVGPNFLTAQEVKAKQSALVDKCGFLDTTASLLVRSGVTGSNPSSRVRGETDFLGRTANVDYHGRRINGTIQSVTKRDADGNPIEYMVSWPTGRGEEIALKKFGVNDVIVKYESGDPVFIKRNDGTFTRGKVVSSGSDEKGFYYNTTMEVETADGVQTATKKVYYRDVTQNPPTNSETLFQTGDKVIFTRSGGQRTTEATVMARATDEKGPYYMVVWEENGQTVTRKVRDNEIPRPGSSQAAADGVDAARAAAEAERAGAARARAETEAAERAAAERRAAERAEADRLAREKAAAEAAARAEAERAAAAVRQQYAGEIQGFNQAAKMRGTFSTEDDVKRVLGLPQGASYEETMKEVRRRLQRSNEDHYPDAVKPFVGEAQKVYNDMKAILQQADRARRGQ